MRNQSWSHLARCHRGMSLAGWLARWRLAPRLRSSPHASLVAIEMHGWATSLVTRYLTLTYAPKPYQRTQLTVHLLVHYLGHRRPANRPSSYNEHLASNEAPMHRGRSCEAAAVASRSASCCLHHRRAPATRARPSPTPTPTKSTAKSSRSTIALMSKASVPYRPRT